ncbi:MAG TPA: DUF6448 family protein [Thermoanaerobaculia bacterium]|nr:DUF6448 family protein [Thermoanaerobaculia bacterium]
MIRRIVRSRRPVLLAASLLTLLFPASDLLAHCDTMDGPVVTDAKRALLTGEVTPVLKWIGPADEKEIRDLFLKTLAVRQKGEDARDLADRYFFETLVRVHRAGEGAPYTGLLPEGAPVEPAIRLADQALAIGDAGKLAKAVAGHVEEGIRLRFTRAAEAKAHADESPAKGRAFVAAYVELTHYVERLHRDATTDAVHGAGDKASSVHAH